MNNLDVPALLRGDSAAALLAHELIAMFEDLEFQRPGQRWPTIRFVDDCPTMVRLVEGTGKRPVEQIDEVLGMYFDASQTIELYLNQLSEAAIVSGTSMAAVTAVVLAHELAHWVTYRFTHSASEPNSAALARTRKCDQEQEAITEVLEGIAELATFAAINRLPRPGLGDSLLKCFKKGHQDLSNYYRAFDLYFEFWPLDQVVGHLIRLARRNDASANRLKDTKDGLPFEYHWLGLADAGEGTYPWMLHREDGPAVVIPPDAPGQLPHDPSGWYRWPSKVVCPRDGFRVDELRERRPDARKLVRASLKNGELLRTTRADDDPAPLQYSFQRGDATVTPPSADWKLVGAHIDVDCRRYCRESGIPKGWGAPLDEL